MSNVRSNEGNIVTENTIESVIEKMNAYFDLLPAVMREENDNFVDLVAQFDEALSDRDNIKYLGTHPHLVGEIRRLNEKIIDVYANTFTQMDNEVFKNLKFDEADLGAKDFSMEDLEGVYKLSEKVASLSNAKARFIEELILSTSNQEERDLMVERLIFVMKNQTERKNYSGASSIYYGLQGVLSQYGEKDGKPIGLSEEAINVFNEMTGIYGLAKEQKNRLNQLINDEGTMFPIITKYTQKLENLKGTNFTSTEVQTAEGVKQITAAEVKQKAINEMWAWMIKDYAENYHPEVKNANDKILSQQLAGKINRSEDQNNYFGKNNDALLKLRDAKLAILRHYKTVRKDVSRLVKKLPGVTVPANQPIIAKRGVTRAFASVSPQLAEKTRTIPASLSKGIKKKFGWREKQTLEQIQTDIQTYINKLDVKNDNVSKERSAALKIVMQKINGEDIEDTLDKKLEYLDKILQKKSVSVGNGNFSISKHRTEVIPGTASAKKKAGKKTRTEGLIIALSNKLAEELQAKIKEMNQRASLRPDVEEIDSSMGASIVKDTRLPEKGKGPAVSADMIYEESNESNEPVVNSTTSDDLSIVSDSNADLPVTEEITHQSQSISEPSIQDLKKVIGELYENFAGSDGLKALLEEPNSVYYRQAPMQNILDDISQIYEDLRKDNSYQDFSILYNQLKKIEENLNENYPASLRNEELDKLSKHIEILNNAIKNTKNALRPDESLSISTLKRQVNQLKIGLDRIESNLTENVPGTIPIIQRLNKVYETLSKAESMEEVYATRKEFNELLAFYNNYVHPNQQKLRAQLEAVEKLTRNPSVTQELSSSKPSLTSSAKPMFGKPDIDTLPEHRKKRILELVKSAPTKIGDKIGAGLFKVKTGIGNGFKKIGDGFKKFGR